MREFDKLKIGFVLALLGTVFALHPIVSDYRTLGYQILGFNLTIWRVYVVFAVLLSLSVYLYAINIITEKPLSIVLDIGNLIYAISLLLIPTYIVIWLGLLFVDTFVKISNQYEINKLLKLIISALIGVVSGFIGRGVFVRIVRREKKFAVRQYTSEEADHIKRAEEMLLARHYDLAVIEAARSIEAALRRALFQAGISVKTQGMRVLVDYAIKKGVIPSNSKPLLEEVRIARNNAVHSINPISEQVATNVTDATRRILSMVSYSNEIDKTDEDYSIDA